VADGETPVLTAFLVSVLGGETSVLTHFLVLVEDGRLWMAQRGSLKDCGMACEERFCCREVSQSPECQGHGGRALDPVPTV
jgi:hypothetical protein